MKKLILLILLAATLTFSLSPRTAEIMKITEIKPGMEGEGKTIFNGTTTETFSFKVLGVIENFSPKKNLIIAELNSPYLNNGGIVSGMSGSPAYIDGKLIGAVAYGFAFTQKPIGGITPIEDILQTAEYNTPTFTIDISTIKVEFDKKNLAFISGWVQDRLAKQLNFSPEESLAPISLMGIQRGFKPAALSYLTALKPAVSLAGSAAVSTSSPNLTTQIQDPDRLKLSPGDAAAVALITGDFEYSASGVVTHVDGDQVYLFGHPFFNLGTVDFPLYKAEVIATVPSYQEPFRLVATKQMVGRVLQDRFSAVQGEIGKVPYLIPMKIFLKDRERQFNIEMVNHPLLTPYLAYISILNVFVAEFQQVGFQSVKVDGKIFIEGEKNITIDDLFSGTDSYTEFGNLLLAITYFLMNNSEKHIKIQKIDLELHGYETLQRSNLENILIDKKSYLPGEVMTITAYLKNERGRSFSETVNLTAPNLKAGSDFYLMAADNLEMGQFDARNIRSTYFPTQLSFLIRAINNLRKNNRLYFRLMTPEEGLFVKGHEYPSLPSGLQNVFDYNSFPLQDISPGDQSRIKYSTIREYQLEFPSVVKGMKLFKLSIKERSDGK